MRTLRRFRLAAAAAALLLALQLLAAPATTLAQAGSCGAAAPSGGSATIDGATGTDGACDIAYGSQLPAWAWFDASVTVACDPATGSGSTREVDGFYLWGITRDAGGSIVSQGYVGTSWQGCGSGDTAHRTYHLQLVAQGYDRTIELRIERRRWPYAASSAVAVARSYSGSAAIG